MITLKTLPQATAQEVFDQCASHLLRQMQKSEDHGNCRYCIGKLACAAGCFIANDEYNPEWEGLPWNMLVNSYGVSSKHEDLINDLQYIHDIHDVEEWQFGLECIAKDHNLIFNVDKYKG